jgi:hypothetical protein
MVVYTCNPSTWEAEAGRSSLRLTQRKMKENKEGREREKKKKEEEEEQEEEEGTREEKEKDSWFLMRKQTNIFTSLQTTFQT